MKGDSPIDNQAAPDFTNKDAANFTDKDTAAIIAELMKDSPQRGIGASNTRTNKESLTLLAFMQAGDQNAGEGEDPAAESAAEYNARATQAAKDRSTRRIDPSTQVNQNQFEAPGNARQADRKVEQGQIPPEQANDKHVTIALSYGEKDFDKKLAASKADTLVITDIPKDMPYPWISPWVDKKGYFFWYPNGNDNRTHHYLPSTLKTIEVNGTKYPVDEMRIQASQQYMREQNKTGFINRDNQTHPYQYAEGIANIAGDALALQKKLLQEGEKNSPDNPYFPIYLSDILVGEAIKPVLDNIKNGKTADFNNPETIAKIDEAINELKKAQQLCVKNGHRFPNMDMQPALHPFSLNPYSYNPDLYWGGALYQAYQREVGLQVMKGWIKSGALKVELP
jgi:hypothetical protein